MAGKEWWRPDSLASRRANLAARGRMVAAIRAFFAERGFTEVETPCLQVSPGLEIHLKAFATALVDPWGGPDSTLYLHTSPEFAMKKLLAGGMERIFQLARVFRNAERSASHSPEFTMLEWYRAGAGLDDMMDETEALVRACATAAGASHLVRGESRCDPFLPWRRLSVAEAFHHHCGFDVLATTGDEAALKAEAARLGVSTSPADRWDDVFFKLMMDCVEPQLDGEAPTILHSWPVAMAALARPSPADPRIAERFEAYACGIELCNAFAELTDAALQRRRFEADMELKQALYGEHYPIDEDFLAALAAGLPDCAGNALGLDRLVMLLTGAPSIEDVLWMPVAQPPVSENS
ncbi:EF-P lysine aminoacylase EpmA [Magnetospirillum sp. UT-4]|uniref:EF-P lysine aminoacylase EpmA n=1 Tax=Magnetospirillum sp. UT-4 TaxID=2681467 RepID=UPI001381743B|nr:EF-P lysine aminoacylase EpmA [Magnetospirillum sp. UT-4]CAA7620319.1 Elongation factor P--(R)-beta-lysine ligase [Magnetospirillum sp. UT-4]